MMFQDFDRVPVGGNGSSAKRILFRARSDIVTRSLVHALAETFTDYEVELVPQFLENRGGAALVAFHADQQTDVAATARRLHELYPGTIVVLLISGPLQMPANSDELIRRGTLQGVIPLTLPLPTWLAAFGLLLAGGLYLPAERMTWLTAPDGGGADEAEPSRRTDGVDEGSDLTHREREVVVLLSKGFQNKIIAARMNLSEHTVKVHVHNIIRKLRVHNRTQAAAFWLSSNGHPHTDTMSSPEEP